MKMVNTSNDSSLDGLQNSTERFFWIFYHAIVILSSVIGDTIILYASIKHNAIKLNKVLVSVIQHISVCDLILVTFVSLPNLVTLVTENLITEGLFTSHHVMCYARVYVTYQAFPASNLFVCLMITSKLFLLKKPLRSGTWSWSLGHIHCTIIWTVSLLIFPVLFLLIGKDDISFEYRVISSDYYNTNTCTYRFSSEVWRLLHPLAMAVSSYAPLVAIIATTIPTLKSLIEARGVSRRGHGNERWQGVVTALLTATVFCISQIPYVICSLIESFAPEKSAVLISPQVWRVLKYLLQLNIMSNFYIYTLTVTSFRSYLWTKIGNIFNCSDTIRRASLILQDLSVERTGNSEVRQSEQQQRLVTVSIR